MTETKILTKEDALLLTAGDKLKLDVIAGAQHFGENPARDIERLQRYGLTNEKYTLLQEKKQYINQVKAVFLVGIFT